MSGTKTRFNEDNLNKALKIYSKVIGNPLLLIREIKKPEHFIGISSLDKKPFPLGIRLREKDDKVVLSIIPEETQYRPNLFSCINFIKDQYKQDKYEIIIDRINFETNYS